MYTNSDGVDTERIGLIPGESGLVPVQTIYSNVATSPLTGKQMCGERECVVGLSRVP